MQNYFALQVCLQLGWKKQTRSQFDVLPLVLSANGHDPEWFDLPGDLVYEIKLTHPKCEYYHSTHCL